MVYYVSRRDWERDVGLWSLYRRNEVLLIVNFNRAWGGIIEHIAGDGYRLLVGFDGFREFASCAL